ncbi:CDF family Co(II)/Ni(II) efflux transporter DmeF [Entomomonas sp. E2T0]|uniref:CDF family Co(II)/Ni(II) efflux transporter DmeF n=1 Tax=Entomomonas sp. E2T0 TaxID=2930213 RepID=UPI0022283642|nr:CDF family Co(II)/Ni(II) efflux transporter DmeF [Entomomonas sp. E2T0]UYZ83594.1 CDF family Co(II)/Ni(II) efflux transporter DmeF [Entomomonas sp. E2T0]
MSANKDLTNWQHSHLFNEGNPLAEKKTKLAVLLTFITMIAEIIGGYAFNSMALLADGWHMSSHTLALGLSVLAYVFARKYAHDNRFAFGTWKIEVLGGFTSAILLALIAVLMFSHSIERLVNPAEIHYDQAIIIAFIGLLVNLACAWLLKDDHHHHHGSHDHAHGHHHDMNLRAAYIHVITDAATSVLAIIALISGKFWGAAWLDPVMGIVGAILVSVWAYGLIRDSGKILLDAEMDTPVVQEIKEVIEQSPIKAKISDLHVWRVGKEKYACIVGLVTSENISPDYFRNLLSIHEELVHITIEINKYET